MYTFNPYIAGDFEQGQGTIASLRAQALLQDPLDALTLKRQIDAGGSYEEQDARLLSVVQMTTNDQMQKAIACASLASKEWGTRSLDDRFEFGRLVRKRIQERFDEFVEILCEEGHPRELSRWEVKGMLESNSEESFQMQRHFMEYHHRVSGREINIRRVPDGVVCLHPPKNAAASNSLLGVHCLMAGNGLVVKAPRSGPTGTLWIWNEIVVPSLREIEAPAGILSITCMDPSAAINQWLENDQVNDIFYFGGSERGLELEKKCIASGKKPILELAGNDGLLVWDTQDIEQSAQAASECFYGSAQICMVPKYVLCREADYPEFIKELLEKVSSLRPGSPLDEGVLLSVVLRSEKYFEVLKEAEEAGCKVLHGGKRIDLKGEPDDLGLFIEPTVLEVPSLELAQKLRAVKEETFFPLLPVIKVQEDQLEPSISFMNENRFGLRNSIWSSNPKIVNEFLSEITNGGIIKINDSHIGMAEGLPSHGGTGATGGIFGEVNMPMLRSTHMQAISDATELESENKFSTTKR